MNQRGFFRENAGLLVSGVIALGSLSLIFLSNQSFSFSAEPLFFALGLLPILIIILVREAPKYLYERDSLSLSAGPISLNIDQESEPESGATIGQPRTNFDLLLTIINDRDPDLAATIHYELPADTDDDLDYILSVLSDGFTDCLTHTTENLKDNINLRDFEEEYGDLVAVDALNGGVLTVQMKPESPFVKEGRLFDINIDEIVEESDDLGPVPVKIGQAKLTEIVDGPDDWCRLEVREWTTEEEYTEPELMDQNLRIRPNSDGIRIVPRDGIDEAYNYLREAQTGRQ